ncbi:MAG: flagellar basal body rod protein FlgB [Spirochaetaceae bacterium]|jgi:flagellar basal-body rod protein FlgB|nr:flagellar basal body rod protein FlgB [Spirochaetaceae bacterium]
MFTNNSFGKTVDILQRTMDVSMVRREVIANNIANAETPNFKRTDVNFEASLARALASEKAPKNLEAKMSSTNHIPFNRAVDYKSVQPRFVLDYLTQTKNNGNNVDIEYETMAATQNQMMYELMTATISSQFKRITSVLR